MQKAEQGRSNNVIMDDLTDHITRPSVGVFAVWAGEVQRAVLFSPKFEGMAESAQGVKFRDDDDSPPSGNVPYFVYLSLAVHFLWVVCPESATSESLSIISTGWFIIQVRPKVWLVLI